MKKFLSVLLAVAMIVSMLAAMTITAAADAPAKKTMNFGSGVIAVKDNVYYGNQKKFSVLSTVGNTTDADGASAIFKDDAKNTVDKSKALFVASENDLAEIKYDTNSQVWAGSDAQIWCKGEFYTTAGITNGEKAQILTTSKRDEKTEAHSYYADTRFDVCEIEDKVFLLSVKEAMTYFATDEERIFKPDGGEETQWWLRSPDEDTAISVGFTYEDGTVESINVNNGTYHMRPAFNVNTTSVLFASKADITDGEVTSYDGNDWKVTLLDADRQFDVSSANKAGNKVTVAYSNAKTGDNEKISYIVTDKDQTEIKYYGSQSVASESGNAEITLPVMAATDKLFVFNEQNNGTKKTNLASALKEVELTSSGLTVTVNVNDDSMGSVAVSPSIPKSGEGITLTATANPGYKFTGFTSGDVKIYTNGNEGIFTMPNKNVTVAATFEAISQEEHTITVVSNYPQMGTASASVTAAKTGDVVTLSNSPVGGNSFVEYISAEVNIEGNAFTMIDKDVTVIAVFSADASFYKNEATPIQAQKNTVNGNAVLRFMWNLTKADGAYLANIGAYIFSWDAFNEGSEVKPAIVLVSKPNMVSGNTFSADYIGIPDGKYYTDYCAIPFINGTFFAEAKLLGNVNTYNVDREAE